MSEQTSVSRLKHLEELGQERDLEPKVFYHYHLRDCLTRCQHQLQVPSVRTSVKYV